MGETDLEQRTLERLAEAEAERDRLLAALAALRTLAQQAQREGVPLDAQRVLALLEGTP